MQGISGIVLPSLESIAEWNNLSDKIISGTVPKTVPSVSMISQPQSDPIKFIPSQLSQLPSDVIISKYAQLKTQIEVIEKHINFVYPLRSSTIGLERSLRQFKVTTDQAKPIALKVMNSIIEPLKTLRLESQEAAKILSNILLDTGSWNTGMYDDRLLDSICFLIFRLEGLSRLCPTRKALADDISKIAKLLGSSNLDLFPMDLRIHMNTPTVMKSTLLELLHVMPPQNVLDLFNIVMKRITTALANNTFLQADMKTAYIVSFVFFVDLFTKHANEEEKAKPKKRFLKKIPNQILAQLLDLKVKNPMLLVVVELAIRFDEIATVFQFPASQSPSRFVIDLSKHYESLDTVLGELSSQSSLMQTVPKALSTVSAAIQAIREMVADRVFHTRAADDKSEYEIAMRNSITDEEKMDLVQIIALCGVIKDYIVGAHPEIVQSANKKALDSISEFTEKIGVQGSQTVDILRAYAQSVLNPESSPQTRKLLQKDCNIFLSNTENIECLLDLTSSLEKACDLSVLYFKECFLDIHRTRTGDAKEAVNFPVTCSLPYILIDFAVNFGASPSLFSPLAIYNDAAAVATKSLRSNYLFEEIRAEASICLTAIARMISEYAFREGNASVLVQNELMLLGKHVDVRRIFAERLDEIFLKAVRDLIETANLSNIKVIELSLESLSLKHSRFSEIGLQSFSDLLSSVIGSATPDSFGCTLIDNIIPFISSNLVPKGVLNTKVLRLNDISADHFCKLFNFMDQGSLIVIIEHLREIARETLDKFTESYLRVQSHIIRIANPRMSAGTHKILDVFAGAYREFMSDENVDAVFDSMRSVGNAVALAQMAEIALGMKRGDAQLVSALVEKLRPDYLLGDLPLVSPPSRDEVVPPVSHSILTDIYACYKQNSAHFDETSENMFDFTTLTGFSAVWSVLEFVFCMKQANKYDDLTEASKKSGKAGPFVIFGEGVFMCAACFIGLSRQNRLYDVLSIGERVMRQKRSDFATLDDEMLGVYMPTFERVKSAMELSMATTRPAINAILSSK